MRTLICGAVLFAALSVAVANPMTPMTGSFTNNSAVITNNIGRHWLIDVRMWGNFSSAGESSIADNNGAGWYLLAAANATNTLAFTEGDAPVRWDNLGRIRFACTGTATNVIQYSIDGVNSR